MDKELKAKWVAALRSGEYKQGGGCLRDDKNRFCCLGVLSTIVNPETILPGGRGREVGPFGYLPTEVRLAISGQEKCLEWEYILQGMNDVQEIPFPQIADYIEANL